PTKSSSRVTDTWVVPQSGGTSMSTVTHSSGLKGLQIVNPGIARQMDTLTVPPKAMQVPVLNWMSPKDEQRLAGRPRHGISMTPLKSGLRLNCAPGGRLQERLCGAMPLALGVTPELPLSLNKTVLVSTLRSLLDKGASNSSVLGRVRSSRPGGGAS